MNVSRPRSPAGHLVSLSSDFSELGACNPVFTDETFDATSNGVSSARWLVRLRMGSSSYWLKR